MKSGYRNEIQGLRAIAVLLVVFYHSNLIFNGGFIGVDVFFVISGYVIMKSLLSEYEHTNAISVRNFVARRIRRLIPASSAMVLFTLIGSLFVLSPFSEQSQIALTSLSSSFFSSNLYFVFQNSYSALTDNPFRHMWSLGVEEQFYVYLICILALLLSIKETKYSFKKRAVLILLITSVISFALSTYLSAGIRLLPLPTRISFFSPITRIWELQLGVLAAFVPHKAIRIRVLRHSGEIVATVGLALIIYAGFTFNSYMEFPGVSALTPTVGALLFILASSNTNVIKKLLSIRLFQFIGNLSYGWYLWHWPLIVFSEAIYPGNQLALILAGFGSIIPAFLSYRFLESRFREVTIGRPANAFKILTISVSAQLIAALGLFLGASTAYGLERPPPIGANGSWAYSSGCQMTELPFPANTCIHSLEESIGTVLLIGDSQAGSISDAILGASNTLKLNFAVWYNDGCPVFPRPTEERSDCEDFQKAIPDLVSIVKPDLVVIANKSSLYGMGGVQHGGLSIRNADGSIPDTYSETKDMWISGIREMFSTPSFSEIKTIYFQQVPTSKPLSPTLIRRSSTDSSFDLKYSSNRNAIVEGEKKVLKNFKNVTVFDPAEYLCKANSCRTFIDGNSLYSDENHLSPYGARFLLPSITKVIQKLLDI